MKDKLPPIGQLGPFIALLIACVIFGLTTERFFSGENFSLILQQVMVVGVIAIGQTLIILTAGIDLSCGMIMALGSIVMTKLAADLGLPAPVAIVAGIGVTTLFGLLNGLLVTRVKLPPFIVTLGVFNIAFAITQLYSGSQTVTEVPALMTWLGGTFALGGSNVAYGTVLMILLYLGVWFWLRETPSGRHVYAVGNNPEATRLVGIPPERVILGVYA
ncbi:MAG: ABC transporter permease, partial [Vitreoscilla sp.]|nr:ABC transporter permease [Vitreoscilla sp.]